MERYYKIAERLAHEDDADIEKMLMKIPITTESLLGFHSYFARRWNLGLASVDIVGTGGDKKNSFNVSTASSILLAAMGVSVTKFGNHAASSVSGSMDVLDYFGIPTAKNPREVRHSLTEANICFINARGVYLDLARFAPIRRKIGRPTIFNYLGPLLNPVENSYIVLGIHHEKYEEPYLKVFEKLGKTNGLILNGQGFDDATAFHFSRITDLSGGSKTLSPYKKGNAQDIRVNSAVESADIILKVFSEEDYSVRRDSVILNAAIAHSGFLGSDLEESMQLAAEALKSRKPLAIIEKLKAITASEKEE